MNDCESDRKGSQIKAADLTVTYTYMSKSSWVIWIWEPNVYHITFATNRSFFWKNKLWLLSVGCADNSFPRCCIKLDNQRSKEGKKPSNETAILRLNWTEHFCCFSFLLTVLTVMIVNASFFFLEQTKINCTCLQAPFEQLPIWCGPCCQTQLFSQRREGL